MFYNPHYQEQSERSVKGWIIISYKYQKLIEGLSITSAFFLVFSSSSNYFERRTNTSCECIEVFQTFVTLGSFTRPCSRNEPTLIPEETVGRVTLA